MRARVCLCVFGRACLLSCMFYLFFLNKDDGGDSGRDDKLFYYCDYYFLVAVAKLDVYHNYRQGKHENTELHVVMNNGYRLFNGVLFCYGFCCTTTASYPTHVPVYQYSTFGY